MAYWRAPSLALIGSFLVVGVATSTPAAAATSFTCVPGATNTCVVTIPLTSDMNETVTSTMPTMQSWSLDQLDGNGTVTAPYSITGTDDFGTQWNGPQGATHGDVWTAILTTGDNEPSGGDALLTFAHTITANPYTSLSETAPTTARPGQPVTITAVVKPQPAKGHVIVERKSGSTWQSLATMTYVTKQHRWSATFKWAAGARRSVTLRIEATAAPGLLTTNGRPFVIRTGA